MAINYTTLLGLAQPVTGTEANTWGTVVNDEITALLDSAVAGAATLDVTAGNVTLTSVDGAADQARMAILIATGTPGTTRDIIAPSQSKTYIVVNQANASVVLKGSATSGVTIRAGQAATCVWNGADFEIVASGDVDGPASATDKAIPTFDGTTGKLIQNNSGATITAGVITATGFSGPLNGTVGATTPSTVVATQVDITAQGDLRLQDTTGGEFVALQAPGTLASSYTLTLPVDDGTNGQALITDGSGVLSWSTAASGDVYGPASATDNAVARYDGTTGKIIQNSAVTIADDGATVIAANSTTDGLRITQIGTGNALLVEDSANPDASPFVVNSGGLGVFGHTSFLQINTYSNLEPLSVYGASGLGIQVGDFGANQFAGGINFGKSRSGTVGSNTIVNNGDALGNVIFNGYDGTAYRQAATIQASVDGTPGTNDMPGRLVFSTTADGDSTPTERMRIDNQGRVGIGITSLTGLNFAIAGNSTGSTTTIGAAIIPTAQSDVTTAAYGVRAGVSTAAAAFTLANAYHFSVAPNFSFGATSTVTNQFGFAVQSNLTGATNNYGFHSNIASGTGRWNFYAAGTADNFFGGNTTISAPAANASPLLTLAGNNNASGATNTLRFTDGDGSSAANQQLGKIEFFSADATTGDVKAYIGSFSEGLDPSAYLAFATAGATTPTERGRISSTGVWSLGAAPGAESLRVTPVASAVNYLEINGAIAASKPFLYANGSDASVSMNLVAKGAGSYTFLTSTGTATQFVVAHTASAVDYLQVTGSSGEFPVLSAQGSSTNISPIINSKGAGSVFVRTGNVTQFGVTHTASAVNYVQISGGTTGNAAKLFVVGSDTNIDLALTPKGTGGVVFPAGAVGTPAITTASDTNTGIFFPAADTIAFVEGGVEAMRIDSSGNLLVGKTTDSFSTQGTVIGPNAEITLARTGSDSVMRFAQTSTGLLVGSINITTTATSYATSSDYRLKENVAPMQNALATVAALKPCTYTWKSTGEAGQGFIAHELQAVVPDCVTGVKDAVETADELDADGKKIGTKEVPRYQGVDTSFLVATLVAAIQELKAEFDAYKATHP